MIELYFTLKIIGFIILCIVTIIYLIAWLIKVKGAHHMGDFKAHTHRIRIVELF
jgi:hypothetical protein